jgi:hypothetical protein
MKKDSLNIIDFPANIFSKNTNRLSNTVFKVVSNKGKVIGLVTGEEIQRLLAEYNFQIEDKTFGRFISLRE